MQQRGKGYIHVPVGGSQPMLYIYGQDPITLQNVHEAASSYQVGPRPLFCTPCRGVKLSDSEVGVLIPVVKDPAREHPASRYFVAETDSYKCWSPVQQAELRATHAWVEQNILPMCSTVLIETWKPAVQQLVPHLGTTCMDVQEMQENRVYLLGKVVPPR